MLHEQKLLSLVRANSIQPRDESNKQTFLYRPNSRRQAKVFLLKLTGLIFELYNDFNLLFFEVYSFVATS